MRLVTRLLGLAASAGLVLFAQGNPAELFPSQANVTVESDGLSRLELPAEVLSQVQGDLSDLRLFDANGNQVPYVVDSGQPRPEQTITQREYRPDVLEVDRAVTESGVREPSTYRENYELELPTEASLAGDWRLVVVTPTQEFVREIDVRSGGGVLIDGGSLFRLRDGRIQRTVFDLGAMPSRTVRVTIDGAGTGFLSPQFILQQRNSLGTSAARLVELTITERTDNEERTVLQVERPRGLQLNSLRFGTTSAAFIRPVSVFEVRTGQPDRSVGRSGQIFRIPAAVAVESLDVEVNAIASDQIRISIENQDSPALQDVTVNALTSTPALLFSMSAGEPVTLRFGGGRASSPRYDLAALTAVLSANGGSVEQAIGVPTLARLGPIEANASYSAEPLLNFASRPGAVVDPALYSHVRTIVLEPSAEGLSRVELTVEDSSHARADFADLRIVDGDGAQWAYLMQRDARSEWQTVSAVAEQDGESSLYTLQLPASPALVDGVRVASADAFFDRPYTLTLETQGRRQLVGQGRLTRVADGRGSDPIEIKFPSTRGESLELEVFNGNDASLSSVVVEVRFPLPDVFTVAPAGSYRILSGYPKAERPVYELERAAPTVLAVRSAPAELGELTANPLFDTSSRLTTGPGSQRLIFWIALVVAVGVLARMTLKTVRNEV